MESEQAPILEGTKTEPTRRPPSRGGAPSIPGDGRDDLKKNFEFLRHRGWILHIIHHPILKPSTSRWKVYHIFNHVFSCFANHVQLNLLCDTLYFSDFFVHFQVLELLSANVPLKKSQPITRQVRFAGLQNLEIWLLFPSPCGSGSSTSKIWSTRAPQKVN